MNKLFNDITTGADNETHEITRVFVVSMMFVAILVCIVGIFVELWHFFTTGQFDLQSFFQAFSTFILAVGGFLITTAGAIKIKAKNEPTDPVDKTVTTFEQTKTQSVPQPQT